MNLVNARDETGTLRRVGYDNYPVCRLCHQPIERGGVIYQAEWGKRIHVFGLHYSCERAYVGRLKISDLGSVWEAENLYSPYVANRKRYTPPFQRI